MALPNVNINLSNGNIGAVAPSPDGVTALVMHGNGTGSVSLGQNYVVVSLQDAINQFGVDLYVEEPVLYKFLENFYGQKGGELWLRLVPDTVTYKNIFDAEAKTLCVAAQGRVRIVVGIMVPGMGYSPVVNLGLDSQVWLAMSAAKVLRNEMREQYRAPVICLVDAYGFTDQSHLTLPDLHTYTHEGVSLVVCDEYMLIAQMAGRLSQVSVQRKVSRVKDGPISDGTLSLAGTKPEAYAQLGLLHDKGYILPRFITGYAGYFVSDDPVAVPVTNDYNSLTACRTIDKAYRIAYQTLINEMNDEVPINNDGTIQAAFIKNWQSLIANAIGLGMTAKGELSADPADANDRGVKVYIDPNQNIVQTGIIMVVILVRPFGYAKYIEVQLGFTVNAN